MLIHGPQHHLTMRRPKQPREDNPAELAADSKHQFANHEIKPTYPAVPCGATPADAARSRDELSLLGQATLHERNNCCHQPLSPGFCWFVTRKQTTGTVSLTNVGLVHSSEPGQQLSNTGSVRRHSKEVVRGHRGDVCDRQSQIR